MVVVEGLILVNLSDKIFKDFQSTTNFDGAVSAAMEGFCLRITH